MTATVPASLAAGATSVTVQPTGGAASNAVAFTVDAPPAERYHAAHHDGAGGVGANAWCNGAVDVTLTAADDAGGSGVASITYAVDGGAPIDRRRSQRHGDHRREPRGHRSRRGSRPAGSAHAHVPRDGRGRERRSGARADREHRHEAGHQGSSLREGHPVSHGHAQVRGPRRDAQRRHSTVVVTIKNRPRQGREDAAPGREAGQHGADGEIHLQAAAGTYRFSVRATDAAGNPQANVAVQRLTVRPANGSSSGA